MWIRFLTRILLTGTILSLCVVCSTGNDQKQSPSTSNASPAMGDVFVVSRECVELVAPKDFHIEVPAKEDGNPDFNRLKTVSNGPIGIRIHPDVLGCSITLEKRKSS